MTLRYYSNAQGTTLADAVTSVANTISVASTSGLPISYPFILILDRGTASEEVVLCTNAAGTALTVTRGYDSTASFSHAAGASVQHGIAAIDAREANAHVNATSGVHGLVGALVGTTDTQTLTHKTLNAGASGTNVINGFGANMFMSSDATGKLVGSNKNIPAGTVMGTTDSQTVTNKTLALGNNSISGTLAQFNAALTDAQFATTAGVETLTNKTLTGPAINNGTLNGTGGTFAGTLTGAAHGDVKPNNVGRVVTAIDFGTNSVTVNGQGKATIAHQLGKNPASVVATMGLNGSVQMRVSVVDSTATNFTLEFRIATTGATASNGDTFGVNWIAVA